MANPDRCITDVEKLEICRYAALKVCVTLEHVCLAFLEQRLQAQAAQRESAESSQKARDLEEDLAELQQKPSLSAQAEAAARLENGKARPLPSRSWHSCFARQLCFIGQHCLP